MKTNDLILQTVSKLGMLVIILFAIHLFLAGHYHPGGGFVGGLVTSGAIVLLLLAFDLKTVATIIPINFINLIGIGLLFSVGTGIGAIFFGAPFLTHAFTTVDIPMLGKTALHTAVLFDTGVYLVVVGVTMTIIQTIGEDE